MRLRFTLRAQADLEDIFNYLEQHSPAGARTVRVEISQRIDQLLDFPLMAPATEMPGVRELSVSRFPYKVY
jgi:toxin ParE1/3/4